jgi:hypothetical protein
MKPEIFSRFGTEQEHINIDSLDILNVMKNGHEIDIKYAIVDGDMKISNLSDELIISNISIKNSEIRGDVLCKSKTFSGNLSFHGTTFMGKVEFESAKFVEDADFSSVTFNGNVKFDHTNFNRNTNFSESTFYGSTNFKSAYFNGNLDLDKAVFGADPFGGKADFSGVNFGGDVNFGSTHFDGKADFSKANFAHDENFNSAKFKFGANFDGFTFDDSEHGTEKQTESVEPVGEPVILTEKYDMGRILYYKENDVYEIKVKIGPYEQSYFMTGEEWKEFTDISGQDERTEFFIYLKEKYPRLSEHLVNNSLRMDFIDFIESSYDGSQNKVNGLDN